ncbi:MAG TPA: AAA family ATPase [Burkholderiaceae bacterium]
MDAIEQAELVKNLRINLGNKTSAGQLELFETHISYVLLAGEFAYKIKKPVTLGFLDFSQLQQREFFCREELRLNRRYAPELYLDVVPISGTAHQPQIEMPDTPIEYAVKMPRFPQEYLAHNLIREQKLGTEHAVLIAQKLAAIHRAAPHEKLGPECRSAKLVWQQISDTLRGIASLVDKQCDKSNLDQLFEWCRRECSAKSQHIDRRAIDGFVRECHGDLHLANIVILNGDAAFFDCIEFSDVLRCIDVINDMAFIAMDLCAHQRSDLCYLFINVYLELTGDYEGVLALRLYIVHRALIRHYVTLLRQQKAEKSADSSDAEPNYIDVAFAWAQPTQPFLVLMHGLSGSGKTSVAGELMQLLPALRVRSDVERKRLNHPVPGNKNAFRSGLYSADNTEATYRRLVGLAHSLLLAGFNVVVDACSLQFHQRQLFRVLGRTCGAPFAIFDVEASKMLMQERIRKRAQAGADASDADILVLEQQIHTQDPFTPKERASVVCYESKNFLPIDTENPAYKRLLQQLASMPSRTESTRP